MCSWMVLDCSYCYIYNRMISFKNIEHQTPSDIEKHQNNNQEIYQHKMPTIQNALYQSKLQWKCYMFEGLLCLMNLLNLVCFAFWVYSKNYDAVELIQKMMMFICIVSAIFYLYATIIHHKMMETRYAIDSSYFTLSNAKNIIQNIIFFAFYLIHPNPIFAGTTFVFKNQTYEINQLLAIILSFRLFNIITFAIKCSPYYGSRSHRILSLYTTRVKNQMLFTIKCLYQFKNKHFFIIVLSVLLIIPAIRMASKEKIGQDFMEMYIQLSYDNIISMSTVGFGEIDNDSLSRIWLVILIIIGGFLNSMLTLTVINFFTLTEQESKAFVSLKRLQLLDEIKQMRLAIMSMTLTKKKRQPNEQQKPLQIKLKKEINLRMNLLRDYRIKCSQMEGERIKFNEFAQKVKKLIEKELLTQKLINFFIQKRQQVGKDKKEGLLHPVKRQKHHKESKRINQIFNQIINKTSHPEEQRQKEKELT